MQAIAASDTPIRSGHLLIDASNLGAQTFAEALPMHACTPSALTNADALMPRLIDVGALSEKQQDDVTQVMLRETVGDRPPVVCAWLDSGLASAPLARHIARFLIGPGPDGQPVFWRYHDPRVFSLAMHLLSPAQKQALLGPVVEWRFAWCQRWWSVRGPGREMDPLAGYEAAWPTAAQWASLTHCELILPLLTRVRDTLSSQECLLYQKEIAGHLLEAQQRWHLSDPDELADYALHCVRYGDDFRHHRKLADAWDQLARGQISWSALLALLDSTDYRGLNREFPWQQARRGAVG